MTEGCSLALSITQTTGSEVDLASLVDDYSPLLFRVAHSVLRSRPEAEDTVQDTFIRVLQHQRKAHQHQLPAIRDLRVWLIRITWNLALDRRRRIRPEQMDDLFAESLVSRTLPADQALHEAQRHKAVFRELERLPQKERQVLLLSALEELATTEIAAILGKSESAVRALLFRARTRLRERLNQGGTA